MDLKAIGYNIRAARLSQNRTQESLAEECEVSTSFLGHIERGTRKTSVITLVKISKALGVAIDALINGISVNHPALEANPHAAVIIGNIVKLLHDNVDSLFLPQ